MRRIVVGLVIALVFGLVAFMLFVVAIVHVTGHASKVYSSAKGEDLAAQQVAVKHQLSRGDTNVAPFLDAQEQAIVRALSSCP